MSTPHMERPPADDGRPLGLSSGDETLPSSVPPPGICVRGDCRGEACPTPCLAPDLVERIACECECHADDYTGPSPWDDEDRWVGCIDCPCPEPTPDLEAFVRLADALTRLGVDTIGEVAR